MIPLARMLPLLVATLAVAVGMAAPPGDRVENWSFRVYLDDEEIGFHDFRLEYVGDGRTLTSKARFEVDFLFFTAYRYKHDNLERWNGNCLERLDARTNDNGKKTTVTGERRDGEFVVEVGDSTRRLPGCVMTFAYWEPRFLEEDRLLNPQTGEYLEVSVEALGEDALQIGDRQFDARRYRLTTRDERLTIWYDATDTWLALESEARGGRTLRYEREP